MFKTLIVEDNPTFRQSLRGLLFAQFPFMEIDEAGSGKEALGKIDLIRPDLIFMDIKLPGENGFKLTKRIKAAYPEIAVIILTSYDLPEYRQAAAQCGASHFLSKDTSTEELLGLVQSILSEKGFDPSDPNSDWGVPS